MSSGAFFLRADRKFSQTLSLSEKNSAKMVINADSYLLYDSCWTTKILTVYLRLIEKGKKKNYQWLKIKQSLMMKCGKYAGVKIIKDNITKCRSNTSHLVMKASLLWF